MAYFAQYGKTIFNGSVVLTNNTPAVIYTPLADEWTDVYSILINSDDTTTSLVTVADGTTTLAYYVGGSAANPAIVDQSSIPVRFRKGAAITVTAASVTGGKHVVVNIRGLKSKT